MSTARTRAAAAAKAAAGIIAALALTGGATGEVAAAPHGYNLPKIRHVFVIVLENEDYASTFGEPAADPYLARTLPAAGALLENYYAIGHKSADNYIALVSGQPPNAETQADCEKFSDFTAPLAAHAGIEAGEGCVYPSVVANIGTQLSAAGLTWKAYEEGMGNDPSRESAACGHPLVGSIDETELAVPGDGYATKHDPFVYFHSVIDRRRYCDQHVVALGSPSGVMPPTTLRGETGLATDLELPRTTPTFSFITPNLCNDGHDYPCVNQASSTSALADIDSFLETWVPRITRSPAFRQDGLLEITFDESEGSTSDSSACCRETPGPGSARPGITGPGGGRVGAVLLSPFIRPGTVSTSPYNHYSSLASWESLLGLVRLADARSVPRVFGADVFTSAN